MAVIALWLLRAPAMALRGAVVTLFLLLVAALVNFRIKLSLHALFAFYSAIILFVVNPVVGAIAFALAFLVFWSRLYLGRHDLLEMLVGASLGLLGGLVTAARGRRVGARPPGAPGARRLQESIAHPNKKQSFSRRGKTS